MNEFENGFQYGQIIRYVQQNLAERMMYLCKSGYPVLLINCLLNWDEQNTRIPIRKVKMKKEQAE